MQQRHISKTAAQGYTGINASETQELDITPIHPYLPVPCNPSFKIFFEKWRVVIITGKKHEPHTGVLGKIVITVLELHQVECGSPSSEIRKTAHRITFKSFKSIVFSRLLHLHPECRPRVCRSCGCHHHGSPVSAGDARPLLLHTLLVLHAPQRQ